MSLNATYPAVSSPLGLLWLRPSTSNTLKTFSLRLKFGGLTPPSTIHAGLIHLFNSRLLTTTLTELQAIAAPAAIGCRLRPQGKKKPMANGKPIALYPTSPCQVQLDAAEYRLTKMECCGHVQEVICAHEHDICSFHGYIRASGERDADVCCHEGR